MVRISKAQIEEGIRAYRGLAEKKEDKLGVFLIDQLKENPAVSIIPHKMEEKVRSQIPDIVSSARKSSLQEEISVRLEDMSYYGIVESELTGKGKREYFLKREYLEGD